MTDVIISSFISLFALFGKVEQVDEERAKEMLTNSASGISTFTWISIVTCAWPMR